MNSLIHIFKHQYRISMKCIALRNKIGQSRTILMDFNVILKRDLLRKIVLACFVQSIEFNIVLVLV